MLYLTIEDFEITQLACTLDFEPRPELMDKRATLAKLYMNGFPSWNLSDPLKLSMKSTDEIRIIIINFHQWGYALQADLNIELFVKEIIQYLNPFCEATKIQHFERVGLRIFYNLTLDEVDVEPPEFPSLTDYFDIPGMHDERISDLIHYQVSTQRSGKRSVLNLGQNRDGRQYFLRPDLNSHDYGKITAENIEATLLAAHQRLIAWFQKYMK